MSISWIVFLVVAALVVMGRIVYKSWQGKKAGRGGSGGGSNGSTRLN